MGRVENLEPDNYPACITVDLGAIRHNVAKLKDYANGSALLAVVKSNGYGFGRTEVAFAAYDEGVRWFAVSRIPEALALRRDFDGARLDPLLRRRSLRPVPTRERYARALRPSATAAAR